MPSCEHCGAETPISRKTGKPCRFCSKKCSHAAWVAANPDRRREHVRKFDASEHGRKNRKLWEAANADHLREYKQSYYAENREEIIADNCRRQAENRPQRNAYKLSWQKTEKGRNCSLQSTRRRLARKHAAGGSHTIDEFHAVCAEFEDHCLMCLRKFDRRKLEIDHVVPISRGGSDGIENLQPLCRRCNASKGTLTADFRPTFWWCWPAEQ